MPTIITHAVVAWATGKTVYKSPSLKILTIAMCCSMIPDADVIGFSLGIPYDSTFGHRGFTHSIFFSAVLASIAAFLLRNSVQKVSILFMYFFIATVSHPVLDAFTNGGQGVAFFSPFSNARYFFPFTPIKVSPIGVSRFISEYGLNVIWSEIKWVWLPSLLFLLLARKVQRFVYK